MPAYKDEKRKTWYVKYSSTVDGKRKQILKRGFAKKSDALDWEAKERGKTASADAKTFAQMADLYYAYNKPKERTQRSQKAMMEKYFRYYQTPLNKIKKADLMDWYIGFTSLDLKPSTKNLCIGVVRSVFKFASDFYELPNPSAGLKRVKQPVRKYDTWTPDQFRQFMAVVDNDLYRAIFAFIYHTGVRKTEALTLRKKDFADGTVHIHGTKTEGSDRVLRLAPALMPVIEPVLARYEDPEALVFHVRSTTLHEAFVRYTEEAKLPPIRIHDLRHSFATYLIGSGANVVAVSKYLGHSSVNQTLKTYTHLFKQADDELVNLINGIIEVSQPS